MKSTWFAAASGAGSALAILAACATDGAAPVALAEDVSAPVPSVESDGGVDAESVDDASTCTDDCEYFPDTCSDDALCASPLFGAGVTPEALDSRTNVLALAGRSPSDAWLAGSVGAAAHFDGTKWTRSDTGVQESLLALWLRAGAEIAFHTPERLYTRGIAVDGGAPSAGGWVPFGAASVDPAWSSAQPIVRATWAHANGASLWIGTSEGWSYTARTGLWRMRRMVDGSFAVQPVALDKCRTDATVACLEVYGLHGRSADEVWAVGPRGAAFRVSNAEADEPTLTNFETASVGVLHGVWAAGPSDVWAVGAAGTVRRWQGGANVFAPYDGIATNRHLRAIAGSSPSDIWIVGEESTVFHYDGGAWSRVKVAGLGGRRPDLEHVWVSSPGKVWVAGPGVLLSLGGKP